MGEKFAKSCEISIHMDKCGRLLTQPTRKLAASATQALCECWTAKNVFQAMGGGGGGDNKPPFFPNPFFPKKIGEHFFF